MLWDIRTCMKPALQVIDLITNVHRTPALAALAWSGNSVGKSFDEWPINRPFISD